MVALVWYDDVSILWKKPLEFFPARWMSVAQQTNALTRLTIYATIASLLLNGDLRSVYLGGIVVVVLAMMYRGRGGNSAGMRDTAPTVCRPSTRENPFANTTVNEYNTEKTLLQPCGVKEIAEDAKRHFNEGLPRDFGDIYEKNNSQRQFHSMPGGGVPDTGAFREFLYGGATNCKTNPLVCTGFNS